MNAVFDNLIMVVPELLPVYQRRIKVLRTIMRYGPLGRKLLAEMLGMTERPLRKDIDLLKEQSLISVTVNGMTITDRGQQLIADLSWVDTDRQLRNRHLEQKCRQVLAFPEVYVIAKDAAGDIWSQMGMAISNHLAHVLDSGHCTIAVAGGSTLSQLVPNISSDVLQQGRSFDVVAARGGLPESTAIQANTLSELLADNLDGNAHVLYSPETMSEAGVEALEREPAIEDTLQFLEHPDVVLYGVGDAQQMAIRRHLSDEVVKRLKGEQAIGEVFGSFFDKQGNILYSIPRLGMHLEDLASVAFPILVAVGAEKAEALTAYSRLAPPQSMVFIDETCAQSVLNGATHLK
ncbi:MAG: hypothetical protein MR008_03395 [Aerococcus sp.]|nr:hypothetical protein [Aerococcus sp.]